MTATQADARQRIIDGASRLYDEADAAACAEAILGLVDHAGPSDGARTRFTERDAWLVAYPDHLRDPGEPPMQTLAGFLESRVGNAFSMLHVLPFFESEGDFGFAVVDHRIVDSTLGSWDDITRLCGTARVAADFVFNHISPDHPWFRAYAEGLPEYSRAFIEIEEDTFSGQVKRASRTSNLLTNFATESGTKQLWTTYSARQVDLNYRDYRVLVRVVELLLDYVARGIHIFRLDAVAYLWKDLDGTEGRHMHLPQNKVIVSVLRAVLDVVQPDAILVSQTDFEEEEGSGSYVVDGTEIAQLDYRFALVPVVAHAAVTGDVQHLVTYARTWKSFPPGAATLNFTSLHDGMYLVPKRPPLPPAAVTELADATHERGGLVIGSGDHDLPYELDIALPSLLSVPGEDSSLSAQRLLTAQSVVLAAPGCPAIYLHTLIGSHSHTEGPELFGTPRAINRQKLELGNVAPDLDGDTFRNAVFTGMLELLAARRSERAFSPEAACEVLDSGHPSLFAVRRGEGDDAVICLANFGDSPVTFAAPGAHTDVITGASYDGDVEVPALTPVWLKRA